MFDKKNIGMLFALCLLSSCNETFDTQYLLTHPFVLKREVERCQSIAGLNDSTTHCRTVMDAANQLMTILNEQQTDPEKFGQRVLELQMNYADLQQKLEQEKNTLNHLIDRQASAELIQVSKEKIQLMTQQLETLHKENQVLLALIGLNSPE